MTGLAGWWPLHENSGSTARDLSGNENHGMVNGATQGVAGVGGLQSYSFDGSNDMVSNTSTISGVGVNTACTIACWFYSKESNNGVLVNYKNGSSDRFSTTFDNGEINAGMYDGSWLGEQSAPTSLNEWHHLAAVWDGSSTMQLYLDGNRVGSSGASLSTRREAGTYIGRKKNGERPFKGMICDVRLYSRELSPQEVKTLYEWGSGDYASPPGTRNGEIYKPSSGVVYFDFEDSNNDASTAVDRWGSVSASVSGASYNQKGGVRGGGYYTFDSSNSDYIRTDSSISLSDPATFSFWFNTSMSPSSEAGFVGLEDDGSHLYQVVLTSSGQVQGYVWSNNSNNWKEYTDNSFNNGEWYHCAVTYDSQAAEKMQIYINGRKESTTIGQNVNASFSLDQKLNIGRRGFQDLYLNGNIDDVRAYNRALSPSEVFQLYQWGTRGRDMRKLTVKSR